MSILFLNKKFNPINLSFVIDTDLLYIDIQETHDKHFFCKGNKGNLTIYVPEGTDFEVGDFQTWFRNVIREVLRREAKLILPERLKMWSEKTGLKYNRLTIKKTSSKWGSYSNLGNINLSLYLLLLPSCYIDYTICHELCHSKEMNHGPRFWELLKNILGDNVQQNRKQMNKIIKKWYDDEDPRYLLITNK